MGITTMWRKSAAAATLQSLFEHQKKHGLIDFSPAAYANEVVRGLWAQESDTMEGRTGPKPHKLAAVVGATIWGLTELPEPLTSQGEQKRGALLFALAAVLQEIDKNRHQFPFHHVDNAILQGGLDTLMYHHERMEQESGDLFRMMGI